MLSVRLDVLDQRLETVAVLIKHWEQISERMKFVFAREFGFGCEFGFGGGHHTASTMRLISSPVRVQRFRRASATRAIAFLSRRTSALVSCNSSSIRMPFSRGPINPKAANSRVDRRAFRQSVRDPSWMSDGVGFTRASASAPAKLILMSSGDVRFRISALPSD